MTRLLAQYIKNNSVKNNDGARTRTTLERCWSVFEAVGILPYYEKDDLGHNKYGTINLFVNNLLDYGWNNHREFFDFLKSKKDCITFQENGKNIYLYKFQIRTTKQKSDCVWFHAENSKVNYLEIFAEDKFDLSEGEVVGLIFPFEWYKINE
jgi:hypothetical protein